VVVLEVAEARLPLLVLKPIQMAAAALEHQVKVMTEQRPAELQVLVKAVAVVALVVWGLVLTVVAEQHLQ
jgi:hypothetical protein